MPYNKEYSGLCDFGRLNLACLTGTNIRAKRWDASSVCGWPLVSSGAKLVGGECSISPQLEQLKGVLSMSHDIVLNNVDLIDKLGKKLTLSDSRAQNNYRMLLELVNVTQHHSNSFDMFFNREEALNNTVHSYTFFLLQVQHFINAHVLLEQNFNSFLGIFGFETLTGTSEFLRNYTQ